MDFSYMAYQFYNFILTFFNLLNDKKENYVPETRALPPEDFNAAIEKAISPLLTRLENNEAQIQKLENKAVRVVFSAAVGRGNYHYGPYNTDKPLIFNKVITNIGNAYKTDTGHFLHHSMAFITSSSSTTLERGMGPSCISTREKSVLCRRKITNWSLRRLSMEATLHSCS